MRKYTIPQNMTLEYFLTDHLGSTSLTADADGAKVSEMRYKPWGEVRYTWTAGLTTTPAYRLADYTFTGQYSHMDDPSTAGVTEGFGLMFYNARWYDPSLGRFAQADTIVPTQTQGVQAWDRYAYVNNAPTRFTDPSGHLPIDDECGYQGQDCGSPLPTQPITISGGGSSGDGSSGSGSSSSNGSITLNGVQDIVTLTLTPDELIQISDNINKDLAAPGGLIEQANNDANTITAVYTIVSGGLEIALCTTLVACPPAVAVLTITSDFVVNGIANDLTQSQYGDLQTISIYFRDVGNDALENGSSDLTIVIFNQMDGGTYIAIEGQESIIIISSGQYYYNYTIVPYIQPFIP